jgi:hypothetical protein
VQPLSTSGKPNITPLFTGRGPSSSMTTMDNQVGGGKRRGGCNVLYGLSRVGLYSLTVEVSALAHRAVPTTTGYYVTLPWTGPRYSQHYSSIVYRHLRGTCNRTHATIPIPTRYLKLLSSKTIELEYVPIITPSVQYAENYLDEAPTEHVQLCLPVPNIRLLTTDVLVKIISHHIISLQRR